MSRYIFDINQPAGLLNPAGGESGASLLAGLNNNFDELYKGSGVVYNIQLDDDISDVDWWTMKLETYSIFSIINDYDFGGNTLNLPAGVTLAFNGGVWSNGTINGSNSCFVVNGPIQAFDTDLDITGSWKNATILPQYYGAVTNANTLIFENNCSSAIQKCLDSIFSVDIPSGLYYFSDTLIVSKEKVVTNRQGIITDGYYEDEVSDLSHTRFYTDQDIDFCIIRKSRFYFRDFPVIDFKSVESHSHAAFVYDLNYFIEGGTIEALVIGNASTIFQTGNGTTAFLFDDTNKTGNNQIYNIVIRGSVYAAKYGIYVTPWHSGRTLEYFYIPDFDIYGDGIKQLLVIECGGGGIIRGTEQGKPNILTDDEALLPAVSLKCRSVLIDLALTDLGDTFEHTNTEILHVYKDNYFIGRSRTLIEVGGVKWFNGAFNIQWLPAMNHAKYTFGGVYEAPVLSNQLSYNQFDWSINAYDGVDYDFDTNLDVSSGQPAAVGCEILYADNLFKLRGIPTVVTFSGEETMATDFIEIVVDNITGFMGFATFYINLYNTIKDGHPANIQCIIYCDRGVIVDRYDSAVFSVKVNLIYKFFSNQNLYTLSAGITKFIIRLIGVRELGSYHIQEIYAQNLFFDTSFIDKGGGQTIYGNLAVNDGVKEVDLPVYADNAAAKVGGLVAGDPYRTSTGIRMVVYD